MPTTTIEITETQREALESFKESEGEPIKGVLGRLIENYDGAIEGPDEPRVRELAREEIRDLVVLEALK